MRSRNKGEREEEKGGRRGRGGEREEEMDGRDDSKRGEGIDPNEPTYCLCHQVSYGEMIGCDNPDVRAILPHDGVFWGT